MKIWKINPSHNSNLFTVAASAAIMAAVAIAASVVFVSVVGLGETQTNSSNPPEHEVKGDLFDALETSANTAAASFTP